MGDIGFKPYADPGDEAAAEASPLTAASLEKKGRRGRPSFFEKFTEAEQIAFHEALAGILETGSPAAEPRRRNGNIYIYRGPFAQEHCRRVAQDPSLAKKHIPRPQRTHRCSPFRTR
jgi:hypothetical protein